MINFIFWVIITIVIISLILIDYLGLFKSKKNQWEYTDCYSGKKYICFDKSSGYIFCDGQEE